MLVDLGLDPYRVDKAIAGFGMPMGPFRQGLGAVLARLLALLKRPAWQQVQQQFVLGSCPPPQTAFHAAGWPASPAACRMTRAAHALSPQHTQPATHNPHRLLTG